MNSPRPPLHIIDRRDATPRSDDWRGRLTFGRDGLLRSSLHNLQLILEYDDRFAGLFWWDASSNQVLLSRAPPWRGNARMAFADSDACELAMWLQDPDHYPMSVGDDLVLKTVVTVARRYARHPIREYLQARVWDGVPRVARMFVDIFGAEERLYNQQAAVCFMVSAVARALWVDPKQPEVGAKVDFMLILEDKQGKKKTTAMETLFGAQWFVETMESPSSNDFYQILQGCWGVEIAEMDAFSKADVTRVKGAITRRVDKYRAPYERAPRSWRRECVFVGTTNENEYLRDPTGGRRFLPVKLLPLHEIDLARLNAERDQLWAEAVVLFQQGTKWWELPEDAPDEQEARYMEDSWEGRIRFWLTGEMPSKDHDKPKPYPERQRYPGGPVAWTTTEELLLYAIGMEVAKHDRAAQMRIAALMKRLGWEHHRREWVRGDGKERRWLLPDSPLLRTPPADPPARRASEAREEPDDAVPF